MIYFCLHFKNRDALQVKERMEELRSMLGWILVHWRAQKQQWLHKKSRQESSQDNIYSEATMCSTITEVNQQRGIYCRHRSLKNRKYTFFFFLVILLSYSAH